MKQQVLAAPTVEAAPEQVFMPDLYQQADMNSYFRMAGEAVGKEINELGATQGDVLEILERARSDEAEVRKAALEELAYNPNISVEMRRDAARLYMGKSLVANQDDNEYKNAEIMFDKKGEEAIALRDGTIDEEGARIDERNGTRREAARASNNVRGKAEAIAVSTAMSLDDDDKANEALLAARAAADKQYHFMPRMLGQGGFTDLGNTLLEIIPGAFTHENAVIFDVLNTSGIKPLQDFVTKYGSGGNYATQFAKEGSGGVKRDIAKAIAKLPPAEKTKLANHLSSYLKQNPWQNVNGGRTLALQNVYDTLLAEIPRKANPEESTNKWLAAAIDFVGADNVDSVASALDSVATVVDPIPFVGGAFRGVRNTSRMIRSAARIAPVSRKAVANEVAAAVRAGGAGVENDLPDMVSAGLPKSPVNFDRSNISVDLNNALEDIDVLTSRIEDQLAVSLTRPIAPISKKAPIAVRNYAKAKGLHGSPSMSTIAISEDGTSVEILGRFGGGDNVGYKTLEAAKKAVANVKLEGFGDVKYSLRDKNSGVVYTEADGDIFKSAEALANSKKGAKHFEWYVDTAYKVPTNKLIYTDGLAESVVDGVGIPAHRAALFASSMSPVRNFYSALGDKIVNGLRVGAGSERATEDMFKTLYNNAIGRIKASEWPAVNNAMRQTQEAGRMLTKEELRALGVESDSSIAGYYGIRRSLETSHWYANRGLSRTMASDNWKAITSKRGSLIAYGKEVEATPILREGEGVRFADETGDEAVRTLSPAEMAALKEKGYTLYENQAVDWAGSVEVQYTAVKTADSAVSIRAVREGDDVLPKEAGYFPEILNDNYVVYGVSKSGRKYAIATSKSLGVAQDFVNKEYVNGAFKQGSEFSDKYKELRAEPFGSAYNQSIQVRSGIYENLGGLTYGKKGATVTSLDGPVGSNYTDPIDAVYTTFRLISDNYTKGSYVQHLENSLLRSVAKYPELLRSPEEVLRRGSLGLDDLVGKPPTHLEKQWGEVKAIIRTIDGYKMLPDPTIQFTSRTAEWLATKSTRWPSAQAFMQRVSRSGFSPVNLWKKFRYMTVMRLRPLPHYQLNAMQAAVNAGWPVSSGKAMALHGVFQKALFARLDYAAGAISKAEMEATIKGLRTFEKVTGLSSDELADLADSYVTNGLWSQVRHNSLMKHTALNDAERITGTRSGTSATLRDLASKAQDVLDSVGAPAGEHFATQFTYLAQYMALRGKNKRFLKTPEGRATLLGRTQDFLGNMTPEGQLGVQRGAFSAMTQFLSYGMKMQMTLIPGLQPTTMTKMDSLRLMVGAVPMYGWRAADSVAHAYKVWLNEYIDDPEHPERREIWEKSPARRLAEHGLLTSAIDALVRAVGYLADTDKNVQDMDAIEFDLSSRVGTGATIALTQSVLDNATAFVEGFGDMRKGDVFSGLTQVGGAFLGLSGNNSIMDIVSRYVSLWKNSAPEQRTYEELDKIVQVASIDVLKKMVPTLSDVERYMILRNYNELMQNGVPTGETGKGSLSDFYYLVGVGAQTMSDSDYYRAQNSIQNMLTKPDDYDKEVRDTARSYQKWLYSDVLIDGVPQELTAAALEKYNAALSIRMSGLDTDFADDVQKELEKLIREDMNKQTKEGRLVTRYVGEVKAAEINKKGYERVKEIRNSGVGRDDAELTQALADWMAQYEYVGGEK